MHYQQRVLLACKYMMDFFQTHLLSIFIFEDKYSTECLLGACQASSGCLLHYDSYLEWLKVYKGEIRGPEITAVHSSSLLKLPSAPKDKRGEFARATQSIYGEKKRDWYFQICFGAEMDPKIKVCILNFLIISIGCGIFLPAGLF